MSSVDETIVREFFELHGFLVCQRRKYGVFGRQKTVTEEVDLVVVNPRLSGEPGLPDFVITPATVAGLGRAIVSIKGWHTEMITPGVLTHHARIFRFAGKEAIEEAQRLVGGGPLWKVLVAPGLPRGVKSRQQTIEMLKASGVDAVISFDAILRDLVESVKTNRSYQKSDLLEVLRLLKNYGLLKEPQLELRFARKRRPKNNATRNPEKPPPAG